MQKLLLTAQCGAVGGIELNGRSRGELKFFLVFLKIYFLLNNIHSKFRYIFLGFLPGGRCFKFWLNFS